MRSMLLATALGGIAIASAAQAEPAQPAPGTRAPLAAVTAPLLPPIQHLDRITTATPSANDPFDMLHGALRHRFASQMMDLYPAEGSGFHLSVGTRFYKKQYIRRDQQAATNGLLYEPRLPRGGGNSRGFRRATPAATFGYTEMIHSNFAVGVEAGTLFGRVVQPLTSRHALAGFSSGGRDEGSTRLNPVLNVTVAYAF